MNERSTDTMERQIWNLLPNEEDVHDLKAVPMSPRHIADVLPYAYQSIRKAIKRIRDSLVMERDGTQFLYARKTGAKPPSDRRGKWERAKC
jgi:hypothetical protein